MMSYQMLLQELTVGFGTMQVIADKISLGGVSARNEHQIEEGRIRGRELGVPKPNSPFEEFCYKESRNS